MTLHQSIHRADVPTTYLAGDLCGMLGRRRSRGAIVALAVLVFAAYFQLSQAQAQEHNHPAADVPIHEKFIVDDARQARTVLLQQAGLLSD